MAKSSTLKPARGKSAKKKKINRFSAEGADKYDLYQMSVQAPEHEVEFLTKSFEQHRGRTPLTLREDFCGTALLCSEWVKSRKDRTATGLDIDPEPLDWGREHNIAPLGKDAERITLLQKNVLEHHKGGYDVAVAFNFSYWIFRTRAQMRSYFEGVRKSLAPDGIFYLDFFGGWQAQKPMKDSREIDDGKFIYVWDQHDVNPIDNSVVNYIHFKFKDGTSMKRAFRYEWRLWTMVEIREVLEEAGFSKTRAWFEIDDEDDEGTGEYEELERTQNHPSWLAYVSAEV